jgi:hypothetical protein
VTLNRKPPKKPGRFTLLSLALVLFARDQVPMALFRLPVVFWERATNPSAVLSLPVELL